MTASLREQKQPARDALRRVQDLQRYRRSLGAALDRVMATRPPTVRAGEALDPLVKRVHAIDKQLSMLSSEVEMRAPNGVPGPRGACGQSRVRADSMLGRRVVKPKRCPRG